MEKKLADLPRILIVQLLRFQSVDTRVFKLNHRIRTPYRLQPQPGGPVYGLVGAVIHRGEEAVSGHYISFTRRPYSSQLLIADDDKPIRAATRQEQDLLHHDSYLLVFERNEVMLPDPVQQTVVRLSSPTVTAPTPHSNIDPPPTDDVHPTDDQTTGAKQTATTTRRPSRVTPGQDRTRPNPIVSQHKRNVTEAQLDTRHMSRQNPNKRIKLKSTENLQVSLI